MIRSNLKLTGYHKLLLQFLILATALVIIYAVTTRDQEQVQINPQNASADSLEEIIAKSEFIEAQVEKIIDGDTINVKIGDHSNIPVRFLGVDTPECFDNSKARKDATKEKISIEKICERGRLAKSFTCSILHTGEKIKLELDKEKWDRYNRLLAYVLLADNRMLNKIILEEGFAKLMIYGRNRKYSKEFRSLEEKAKSKNKGLWGKN